MSMTSSSGKTAQSNVGGRNEELRKRNSTLHGLPRCFSSDIINSGNAYAHYSPDKIFKLGELGSGLRPRGDVQDFYQLKQKWLAIRARTGELFEDTTFSKPDQVYAWYAENNLVQGVTWLRPKDIVDNPKLFVDGVSRFDVQQGKFGDCWLLSSISNLAMHRDMLLRVVPEDQSFEEKNYAGIFHFRFWYCGRWVDVVIDDFLPTKNGKLICVQSGDRNEFWSALLVKAYAKLYGSWDALHAGSSTEATEDLTGGISTAEYNLTAIFDDMLEDMGKNHALIGCGTPTFDANGLKSNHAYAITKVLKYKGVRLLRLKDPFGDEVEWNGPWSDNSKEWKSVPDNVKEELGMRIGADADGEFWMAFEDFQSHFNSVTTCYFNSGSLNKDGKRKWKIGTFDGEWVRGVTAGHNGRKESGISKGWIDPLGAWLSNSECLLRPVQNLQYRINLGQPDQGNDKCTVIVSLMQKHQRVNRNVVEMLDFMFQIYRMDKPHELPKPLDSNFFESRKAIVISNGQLWADSRSIGCRVELPPGDYCITPILHSKGMEAEFLLRVCSEYLTNMEEWDEQIGLCVENNDSVPDSSKAHSSMDYNDNKLKLQNFQKYAHGALEVGWKDLRKVLQDDFGEDFREYQCRSIVSMLDKLDSGKIGFREYLGLWNDIGKWRTIFNKYDKNGHGHFETFELRKAVKSAGYNLNNYTLKKLVRLYESNVGKITFRDYVMCTLQMKTMIDSSGKNLEGTITKSATFGLCSI